MQDIRSLKMNAIQNNPPVHTWALPDGAIARLGRGRKPDIVFSPDGKYLGVGTSLGLWLYNLETLSPIALWETKRGLVGRIAFSPNGEWIATSNSDYVLKVLDLNSGVSKTQIETEDYITGLIFSPDNHSIAAAYARTSTVEVWNVETGESDAQYYTDNEIAYYYRTINISPNSQLIASTCKSESYHNADEIVVWEVGKQSPIVSLNEHHSWVSTLCFSPCGQFLASGGEDGTVYVWDVDTWQQVKKYTDYGDVYRIIPSYSTDGILRAVIIDYDDTDPVSITVCDLESGEQLYKDQVWGNTVQFSDKSDWGNAIEFSNGSQLAYECRHEFINVWTLDNPIKRQFTHSPISFPTSAVFSEDGLTLAVEHHHEGVVLWDIESKRSRPAINVESAGKNQFVYKTQNGQLFVASIKDDNAMLWEADDETPLIEGTGRKYWSAFPVLSPTGKLFAYASEDGKIKVFDVKNGKQLYVLPHPLIEYPEYYEEDDFFDEDDDDDEDYIDDGEDVDTIKTVKFSYDDKHLASESTYGGIKVWNIVQRKVIASFSSDLVPSIIGFSPCGQYLACNGDRILLWNTAQSKLQKTELNQGSFEFIEFSPDGRYLACSGYETFLYNLERGEIHTHLTLPQECDRLYAAAFSTCSKYLAAGGWWTEGLEKVPICLWEIQTGRHITTFWGHPTDIQALAFSPDNKLLASASYDGTILLWDLTPYI